MIVSLLLIIGGLFVYAHLIEGRSLTSWVIERYFWLSGRKKQFEELSGFFQENLERSEKISSEPYENPSEFVGMPVQENAIENMQVFTWNDKNDRKQRVILYMHGGAYIHQPTLFHFKAVANMANQLDAKVVFPIYPKAPAHQFEETYDKLSMLYIGILNSVDHAEQITIMGDSAGGGLALGFAMYARDSYLPQPKDIILISPWLDVEKDNPEIEKYEAKDPMLSSFGLNKAGLLWAGSEPDMKNPYVSPIFGNFEGLGKISIFVGTHEIFVPDIEKFHHLLTKQGIDHNYTVVEKMNHVYVIYPIPEAIESQRQIVNIIKEVE